jgi:glycosyltransferase involved in cell wall biosynthesis
MRIAQINTYTTGGASIVAKRLHEGLLNSQVDSILLSKYGIKGAIPKHIYFKDGRLRNFLRKHISSPSFAPVAKILLEILQHPNLKGRPRGFEIFSPLNTDSETDKFQVLDSREIIHLHWVNDFIDYELFFRKFSKKKFVWTLHDMNPITGGCHHSDGCLRFESVCAQCPQLQNTIDENYSRLIQDAKLKALSQLDDDQLIIASPSNWLAELSKRSQITKRFRHIIIPNPTFKETTVFEAQESARQQLGLPLGKKIIMFASENLNNPRKGVDLLFKAIQLINTRDIVLLGIGQKSVSPKGVEFVYTGRITSAALLAQYFRAADIFVTPTIAENSPLVVIEALSCGTPVVASRVGGIPDLINNENGILFPVGNISELARSISKALFEINFNNEDIRKNALAIHDPLKVAEDYIRLYKSF